jgi:DNA end-binding protein Ku
MARAIWSGVLSFGLVSVPVQIYSATEGHEPSFHQYEQGTKDRIRYQRVNERTGKEVDYEDIVRGAKSGRKLVLLDDDELSAVAPGRSRAMDVDTFVDLDEIDPLHFDKSYFLGPGNDDARKPYALLRDAMADANRAAVASFVMRNKEYLGAIRADGDVLVLETLFFADEVRNPKDQIDNLPGKLKLSAQEKRMAGQLIDSMTSKWQPKKYRDTYTDRVNKLIKAKARNADYEPADEAPEATNVVDLVEALRQSVDAARGRGSGGAKKTAAKKSAKKSPAKKSAKKSPAKKPAKKSPAKKPAKKGGGRRSAAKKSA